MSYFSSSELDSFARLVERAEDIRGYKSHWQQTDAERDLVGLYEVCVLGIRHQGAGHELALKLAEVRIALSQRAANGSLSQGADTAAE